MSLIFEVNKDRYVYGEIISSTQDWQDPDFIMQDSTGSIRHLNNDWTLDTGLVDKNSNLFFISLIKVLSRSIIHFQK